MPHPPTLLALAALGLALVLAPPAMAQDEDPDIARSVVKIVTHAQGADWYTPWNARGTGQATGSGFVIDGGRVMTNAHVVSDARMLLLFLHNDPDPHPARVVAIGHDCDLALLEPEDPALLADVPALSFGGLPAVRSTVETYGYPSGGKRISTTAGVVSRIEVHNYVHSGVDGHLAVQTDAAINPGNSGGPVIQDGAVVGVAFQGYAALDNVGLFIPTEVVDHFLVDIADGSYDGYPELGALVVNMENDAARAHAGMGPDDSGVRVDAIHPGSSADGHLRIGDVILEAEGYDVANDGTIDLDGLRLAATLLYDRPQKGESLQLTVLRDGARMALEVPLIDYVPQRSQANLYDQLASYYVYAGLVFVPLNRETLKTFGGSWPTVADKDLLYEFFYRALEEGTRQDLPRVLLLRKLDHPVNANLPYFRNLIVERVNDRPIASVADVIAAIENHDGEYHLLEFMHHDGFVVLDRAAADAANADILEQYAVPEDRR